jgi:hypothetical protein
MEEGGEKEQQQQQQQQQQQRLQPACLRKKQGTYSNEVSPRKLLMTSFYFILRV